MKKKTLSAAVVVALIACVAVLVGRRVSTPLSVEQSERSLIRKR